MDAEARARRRNSFDPRVGTAQFVFGCIYASVTVVAVMVALRVWELSGEQPWLQYVFGLLFLALTLKSFFIWQRTRSLRRQGQPTEATLTAVESGHGVTVVCGYLTLQDPAGDPAQRLPIETRLAGEHVGRELNALLRAGVKTLPALLVNPRGGRPRGMFLVRTRAGLLTEDYRRRLEAQLPHARSSDEQDDDDV